MEGLKDKRIKRGITQADIAKRLGLSARQYIKYENGDLEPKKIIKEKIEEIFIC